MNLVKWFRKNKTKVMAVVVIVIMVGFVGGSYLRQLAQRRTGMDRTIAWHGADRKITNRDMVLARQELSILQMLGAEVLLAPQDLRANPAQDLQRILLGEVLFSGQRNSAESIIRIRQMIRLNQYRISDKQINDIYRRSMNSEAYWLLLKTEAEQAGVRISNEDIGYQLARIIPQLTGGATYSQYIMVLMNRHGVSEQNILSTFGKLLAVMEYAKTVCSSEDVTSRQIMQTASLEQERISIEFVKFDSALFAEEQDGPTQQQIQVHFDKYKKFFPGAVSEENPYGFGYKLAEKLQLEYIAVKLDEVSEIITATTQQETEEYYRKHRERFSRQVLSDPNDPNSPLLEQSKSYAEVAGDISNYLLKNKINSKAEEILRQADTLTNAGFEDADTESGDTSTEPLQIGGDYKSAAEQLSKEYKTRVYAGQTGLLGAADIRADKYMGRLYLEGYGYDPVTLPNIVFLPQIVFAIDELGVSELGPFDVAKPRLYENIGPMKDMIGEIMLVLRTTQAHKATEPESVEQTFSRETIRFDESDEELPENVYSVKEEVIEDLKKLSAMDSAKAAAEEFVGLVEKDGWAGAIEKFNKLYGQRHRENQSEPNVSATEPFELENFTNLRRIPGESIGTLSMQSRGNPVGRSLIDAYKKNAQFTERLYGLVPQDTNSLEDVPLVIEFKPDMSHYCIKAISINRLYREEYEKIKALQAYRKDVSQSQSLAMIHFGPENISRRMNFRWAEE